MSGYLLGAGFVVFSSMFFHHYRKYREDLLAELYLNHSDKASIYRDVQNKIATQWDEKMKDYEWAKRIDKYRKVLCSYAEGKVLEVGIGTGLNLPFYPKGIKLIGVDWSENMLEECVKKNISGVLLTKMDGKSLAFPDNTFDTVVAVFLLSSSESPEEIMKEIHRVCKLNGKILILDRGKCPDLLTMVLLNLYRYEYIFEYGYDQCANISQVVKTVQTRVISEETRQGGHIYFYILEKTEETSM